MASAEPAHRVLVISGSTRHRSTNTALCLTAAAHAPDGIAVECFAEIAALPHFDPDDDHDPLPAPVTAVRSAVTEADAVLFCTPEYAGTLPGTFKNLLDWMVGGTALSDKPVAWVNVAPDPHRGHGAHATLATVLGYVGARVVEPACGHVPISKEQVGADGLVDDAAVGERIRSAVRRVVTS